MSNCELASTEVTRLHRLEEIRKEHSIIKQGGYPDWRINLSDRENIGMLGLKAEQDQLAIDTINYFLEDLL